jgi:hypothetical protein
MIHAGIILQGCQVVAFCHNGDVCALNSFDALAHTSERQYAVSPYRMRAVYEQNIQSGFDVAVLESIVKQYDFGFGQFGSDSLYTCFPLFAYGNPDILELAVYLERFVSDYAHRRVIVGKDISFAIASVTSAQNNNMELLLEQSYKIFRVWSLSGAAYGNVSDAYGREFKLVAFDKSIVEQFVSCCRNPRIWIYDVTQIF